MVLELPLRENRLCSEEERQLPRGIELVLEVQGNVWRNPHASRSRCAWVSEKILVILGMLDFDLRTQTNRKNISPAKQLMATNEIQGAAEIIGIKHVDPLPEIWRKKSEVVGIAIEPERASIELNFVGSNA